MPQPTEPKPNAREAAMYLFAAAILLIVAGWIISPALGCAIAGVCFLFAGLTELGVLQVLLIKRLRGNKRVSN